jgi:hypothetical protein
MPHGEKIFLLSPVDWHAKGVHSPLPQDKDETRMDDAVSWPVGPVRFGAHRYGETRNDWRIYVVIWAPMDAGHCAVSHLTAADPHVIDCFGNLVPVPAWRRQPEEIEA